VTLRSTLLACGAALALGLGAVSTMADNVTYEGFQYKDVSITGYSDGAIIADAAGQQKTYALKSLDLIEMEDQTAFNKAEQARKAKDWASASEHYSKAMTETRRALRPVVEARAIAAFDHTGKYVDAMKAFIDLYALSPTAATYALRPQNLPEGASQMLGEAATVINARINDSKFRDPAVQNNLKAILIDIYTQAKDPRLGALVHAATGTPEPTPGVVAPVAAVPAEHADNLSAIDDALSAKKYDDVIKTADTMLPTAEGETAVHLYMAQAQAYAALNKPEDAEAAYLRVAIHYPQHSQAPTALLEAAGLEKKTNPDGAKRLLKELVEKYPNSPAAEKAK
jgi:tetratricopeptide (TPR) repeat protein